MIDPMDRLYSPSEMVTLLEASRLTYYFAATTAAFWPTIKAALIEYEKANPERVAPVRVFDIQEDTSPKPYWRGMKI